MNLEKFTDRAKGFLQSAQTVAIRMSHQRISPEHILKALLEDSEGMAAGLIARAGGQAPVAAQEVDALLAKVPDWRWQRDRGDSLWYPNMDLLRQTTAADWDDVMARAGTQLAARVGAG